MKKIIFLAALIYSTQNSYSQVPKKVVVEHFTNSVCSACASKNPGFYTNYASQTGVIHLAVHPSSPYASCILSQHNVAENNARTNYYGVFGSTPRLVVQGAVSTSTNYSLPSVFTPYLGQTSPASIKIVQSKYGNDSIRSRIVIKTEATHSLGTLVLFVALAEDTIFYTSPNGETKHFDVFRKSLTGATGLTVTLPATVGDSIVYSKSSPTVTPWNFSRIFTLAILQDAITKSVVQAQSVLASSNNIITQISNIESFSTNVSVYPNPASNKLFIFSSQLDLDKSKIEIMNFLGQAVLKTDFKSEIDISTLGQGAYFLRLKFPNSSYRYSKFVKE